MSSVTESHSARGRGLNASLLTPIMSVLVVSLGAGGIGLYYGLRQIMYNSLEQKAQITEAFLAKSAPDLIWNYDTDGMRNVIDQVLEDPEFKSLIFLNEQDKPFTGSLPEIAPQFEIARDIIVDDAKVGSFRLGYSDHLIASRLRYVLLGVLTGIVLLVGVLGLIIHASVTRATGPLVRLTRVFGDATANADLTVVVPEENSREVGALGRALNQFTGRIRETLGQVQRLSGMVREHSETIGDKAHRVGDLVESQQRSSQEISQAVKDSAQNLNELNSLTQSVANKLEQMVNKAKDADVVMVKLGDSSTKIQTVLESISTIADNTNLLALNAAIEAARAGDAGRGFAVVADEVKKLSGQTMKSTSEITDTINVLRRDIEQTQHEVQEITTFIRDVQKDIAGVAQATERQSATMEEVSSTVDVFLNQFSATEDAMRESKERIGTLLGEVDELGRSLKVFKV